MSRTVILLPLIFVISFLSKGQTSAVYNINKYNGLSTNHVYCLLVDRLGYLWMGTTDGVYRYNGYTLRKYDYSDGLPNVDVWNLYEDKQGRIWFRAIAQQMGYVKNGEFYKVYKDTDPNLELYPGQIFELDNNTIVFNNITSDVKENYVVCIVKDDTLRAKHISMSEYSIAKTSPRIIDEFMAHTSDSLLQLYNLKKLFSQNTNNLGKPDKILKFNTNLTSEMIAYPYSYTFGNNLIVYYKPSQPYLNCADIYTKTIIRLNLREVLGNNDEQIVLCYIYNHFFYCITRDKIVILDSNMNLNAIHGLKTLFPGAAGFNTTFFCKTKIWGELHASSDGGMTILYPPTSGLEKKKGNIMDYVFINNKNDTDGYWWNNKTRMLAIVNKGEIRETISLPAIHNLRKIITYDSVKKIVVNELSTSWLYATNAIDPITIGIDTAIHLDYKKYSNAIKYGFFNSAHDILVAENRDIYMLGSPHNIYKVKIDQGKNRIYYTTISNQRFKNILLIPINNTIVSYAPDKILLINPATDVRIQMTQSQLEALGINAIEKIIPDSNGNLFIKDYNSIKVFNGTRGTMRTLLKNYNLKQAKIEVINNKLFIAGSFGILNASIQSNGNITIVNNFQNTKNIYYRYLFDVQFAEDHALLKTDNGFFVYHYDKGNGNNNNNHINDYTIIADYSDSLHTISNNDTLVIEQNLSLITLDVIKPTGTGGLRIEYALNKSPYQFSENQLILPSLKPGSYNTISLIASDDSWRSQPLKFTVYIQPKWWQTQTAKRVIFVLSLLAFIGFVYMVIVMTRRFVDRSNERRNQRRELELKSIYSQINPHFIFNSLSTAQYFVKKNKNKEAFEHINQFSDLLRSYIKSSRAKYITIAEEIENLENYLQLQLTRFEEKFDYTIEVDKSVDAGRVKIPSLLLQPLVENALNHGIFHSDKKGNLSVIFKIDEQDKDTLVCIVDDDGIGRQRAKELRGKIIRKADSYGTILIKELIDTFNKYEKIKIEIEYIDKQPPLSGTTVAVRISNYAQSQ